MIQEYLLKHRPTPAAGCEEFVFLTPQGRQVAHISDDLRALSKDFPTSMGTLKVTATEMRKLTSTNVAADGSEDMVRKVAAHVTHGEDTARKYYRHMQGIKESVNAYKATATTSTSGIGQKRPAEEKENDISITMPKMKRRIKWLPEEEEELKKYFDIEEKPTPSCEECSTFLNIWRQEHDVLFLGRSPKEVQDKCRTIKRQLSKKEQ